MELTYKFDPAHLHDYRKLASGRGVGSKRNGEETWGLFLICTLGIAAILAATEILFPGSTSEPLTILQFLAGLVLGVSLVLAILWWRYFRFAREAVRPDGPTMAEHRLSVSADGLRVASRFAEVAYRWKAFEALTVDDGIIVLWLEPGAGVVVPRSAFADPAAERAFLEAVRGHLAGAAPASPKR